MGLRTERVKNEVRGFVAEVFRENGPRYKNLKEWPHLYVDFWVSLFAMSYTLGHIAAVLVPVAVIVIHADGCASALRW
jgi:hypothetical protein